jgi:hypothetical protein
MVFKTIARIKAALPDVIHIIMFYNDGTIFQTTFEQNINIPKLGEFLARIINKVRKVNDICKFKPNSYKKLIFEMEEITIIIVKLGEYSNIALFFSNESSKEINLTPIKRYLVKIEDLIDMDKKELIMKQILDKEEESKILESHLNQKSEELNRIKIKIEELFPSIETEKLKKEYNTADRDFQKLKDDLDKIKLEILNLRSEIEKVQKR